MRALIGRLLIWFLEAAAPKIVLLNVTPSEMAEIEGVHGPTHILVPRLVVQR